jgi:type II secretory pathway pseudopilin PulG
MRTNCTAGTRGETLVETLLSIVLLGILAAGILGALVATTTTSDFDAKQAASEPGLRSYADAWGRATYAPCTAGSSANPYGATAPPGFTAPVGYTASVTAVKFWNGTSTNPAVFTAACPAGGDQGLQELSLQLRSPQGPAQTVTIDRRSP